MIHFDQAARPPGARAVGIAPFDIIRVAMAAVLLSAGALKGLAQWTSVAPAGNDILASRNVTALAVGVELSTGIWFLLGLYPKWSRVLGLVGFTLLGVVAAMKIAVGARSCGCFGDIQVNPWHVLCLDAASVAALIYWRPRPAPLDAAGPSPARVILITLSSLMLGAIGSGLVLWVGDRAVTRVLLFEPKDWLGKPFPLIAHTNIPDKLSSGKWVALIYHSDCPSCRAALPSYERLARDLDGQPDAPGVALIEASPFSRPPTDAGTGRPGVRGIVRYEDHIFKTPMGVKLADGILVEVSDEQGDVDLSFPR